MSGFISTPSMQDIKRLNDAIEDIRKTLILLENRMDDSDDEIKRAKQRIFYLENR